jgi:hypothetical protein
MVHRLALRRFSALVLFSALLSACGEGGPTEPMDRLDLPEDQPLAAVMPDLSPDPGTAGTERYVPTLERVLRRSVGVIKMRMGEDAAAKVLAEVQRLQSELRAAKEAGDTEAFKRASQKFEGFAAQVGLRVFGAPLARHVHQDASQKLRELMPRLRAAAQAGQDLARLVQAVQGAERSLAAAREAWENEKPAVGLVFAARALDVVTKVGAMVP